MLPEGLAIDHLVVTMHSGKASVPLVEHAVTGDVITEVEIDFDRDTADGGTTFLTYLLEDVVVSSAQMAWVERSRPRR